MIPKVIWTFWDSEELPEFIQKCIETWKYHNPDYNIIVMNLNNYNQYIDVDVTKLRHYSSNKPQLTSDYVRTCVLKKHGGVWMDASIICIKPIVFRDSTEFFAYYLDNYGIFGNYKYPMIENWFIAVNENNLFMDEWYKEFIIETEKYLTMDLYVWSSNVDIRFGFSVGYYAMHNAAQKVFKKLYQENRVPKMTLKHASVDGPLISFSQIFIGNILCNTDFDKLTTTIIKLNGEGRRNIRLNKGIYDCILKKIEHFGSDNYIEDTGTNNLDGILQVQDEKEYKKRMIIFIISLVVLLILIIIVAILLKNRLK